MICKNIAYSFVLFSLFIFSFIYSSCCQANCGFVKDSDQKTLELEKGSAVIVALLETAIKEPIAERSWGRQVANGFIKNSNLRALPSGKQ